MVRVCFVVGARPNFMKAAPVYRQLAAREPSLELLLVHTGQHYDAGMSEVFFEELGLPAPDEYLGIGSGTHAEQTARALVGVEQVLRERRADMCVVAGDVNSTLAGALAAAKASVLVAHIEAGLRSFDRTMPEEHNRTLTDHLSDVLLTHSEDANANLAREGISAETVHFVGNTMIDSLLEHLDRARGGRPWERFGVEPGSYVLVTLHRPGMVDDAAVLAAVTKGLVALAHALTVVFPVHPRTRARLDESGATAQLHAAGVHLAEPLGYNDFLGLEAEALAVVTDSGGVQEETSALGVRCFTLRNTTERPVTLTHGTNTLLGARPERMEEIHALLGTPKQTNEIPLWDGHAGARAADAIRKALT